MCLRSRVAAGAAALALLATACASSRPAPLPRAEPFRYEGYAATYPTGLRLVVVHVPGAPRATLVASYAAGVVDEPPGKAGLAELAFALTGRARPGEGRFNLAERLFAAGARDGLDVGDEDSELRSIGRASRLDALVAIEVDRLRDPLSRLDEREFLILRENLVARLERQPPDLSDPAEQQLQVVARALAGTPYARPGPTPASLRSIALEDVRRFLGRAMEPARAVWVVTTPEPPRAVAERVLAALGRLAVDEQAGRAEPVALRALDPSSIRPETALETRAAPGATRTLWLAWPVPGDAAGQRGVRAAAAELVEWRLAEAKERGRLDGLVTAVWAGATRAPGAATVWIRATLTEKADLETARARLAAAARGKGTSPSLFFGLFGLEQVRSTFADADVLSAVEGGLPDAADLVRATGKLDPLAARAELAAGIGSESAAAFVEAHLRPERAAALAVLPGEGPTPVPSRPSPDDDGEGWVLAEDLLSDATPGAAEVATLVSGPGLAAATRHMLPNGLEVVALPRGALPVVDVRLVIRPDTGAGPGPLATWLALALSRKEWTLTGAFDCTPPPARAVGEAVAYRRLVPAAHLPAALERLRCVTRLRFSGEDFGETRERLAEVLERERGLVDRVAAEVWTGAYGDAGRSSPSPAAALGLEARAVGAWFDVQFRPERSVLVLAGKVEPGPALWAEVERHLGAWRRGAVPPAPLLRRPEPAARRIAVVDAPGADRAHVSVALRLPPRAEADAAAERVLARALRIRLGRELVPHGDVAVEVGGLADDPALLLSVATDLGRAPRSIGAALDALHALAREPLPDHEADLARWHAARREAYRFDTVAGAAAAAERLFVERRPLDAWDRWGEDLAAVDPESVRRAAAAAGRGGEVIVVAGDAARLAPALRAAGFEVGAVAAPPTAAR